ncbi:MAG: YggU family protein [Gemmatimonadetes bacterium]|nr:YggU family protein [Gemmatimonadota bacterium]
MGRLACWIQPRATRTEVVGRHGDAIRIRIAAPPVDGAANDELVRFLAEQLGVSRRAVRLKAGATGRKKTVEIDGLSETEAEKRLGLTKR